MTDCCHQEECLYSVCVEQEVADRVRAEERGNDDGIRQDAGTLNENDFDERRASKGKRETEAGSQTS